MGKYGDRRTVFSYCLQRLVLLIMIGGFSEWGKLPVCPQLQAARLENMLFIDANQYLDLYRMDSGKALLDALE